QRGAGRARRAGGLGAGGRAMTGAQAPRHQAPPLEGFDAVGGEAWLVAAIGRAGVTWIEPAASALGRFDGSAEGQQHARLANRFTPELSTHDRTGERIDAVDYHPSYHALMARAIESGLHSTAWKRRDA